MSDQQMLDERRETWNGFVKMAIWSTAAAALTLALMRIFLV
ncbi:MAG: aa3-type cytochrome c oxidase subunit IV [Kiloniellales bacterium]